MKYEDIKKMGEAYAQVQEKMRLENAKRAEAMLKDAEKDLSAQMEAMGDSKDDDDQIKQRKKLQNEKAPKVVNKDVSVKGIAKASDKYRANLKNATEGAKQGEPIKGKIGKPIKADASNDKSDDGDGMDKVDKKAAKKKFGDRKDKDIDNDGDVDSSDQFLHKRRKAISKNSESKGKKEVEVQTQEKVVDELSRKTLGNYAKGASRDLKVGGMAKGVAIARGNKKEVDKITGRETKRQRGIDRAIDKMSRRSRREGMEEAASTGAGKNSDSVAQDKTDGMSPNAKKELARATNNPAVDAEKSNKLNFATFKKMTKKSKDNG